MEIIRTKKKKLDHFGIRGRLNFAFYVTKILQYENEYSAVENIIMWKYKKGGKLHFFFP